MDEIALPAGLDLLWGKRQRGSRGPKPALSINDIASAAIRIADAEGLAAVSMARVATELGYTTMSLYRYVTNKDELLQVMWNASAEGAESLVLSARGWRGKLRQWALLQRDLIDRHPWITEMPMAAPPLAPNSLTFVERGLEALDTADGLYDADKLRIIGLISSYTLSEARMAHDAARAAASADTPPVSFERLLLELVDAKHYPRLHRIARANELGDNASGFEEREEFAFGLERILDGVEALIAKPKTRDGLKR